MNSELERAVEKALAARILRTRSVGGGDINEAFELELSDARRVFLKTNDRADVAMFPAEARGLGWLAEANALRIPEVIAVSSGCAGEPAFLVLEHIQSARPRGDFDELLGHGLAALHRFGAPSFGLDHDNFIGRLPQANATCESWAEFWRERRLEPQLRLAQPRLGRSLVQRFDRLLQKLDELVGPAEPPQRLHGDLWGGNLHVDETGAPCLIDPAAYGGHREVDLAMMRLFGGFAPKVFAAYAEAYPLMPGADERIALYQLYPLLVHVNLFGAGYVGSVEGALSRLPGLSKMLPSGAD